MIGLVELDRVHTLNGDLHLRLLPDETRAASILGDATASAGLSLEATVTR